MHDVILHGHELWDGQTLENFSRHVWRFRRYTFLQKRYEELNLNSVFLIIAEQKDVSIEGVVATLALQDIHKIDEAFEDVHHMVGQKDCLLFLIRFGDSDRMFLYLKN